MMLLSLPMISNANARARSELCQQNLIEMGQAVTHYARDTNYMPTIYNQADDREGMSLPEFINPRVHTPNVLFCPSDETEASQDIGTSYRWGTVFNNQRPAGIGELVGQEMLADRDTYHANSGCLSNKFVVTENNKGYHLSLVAGDPRYEANHAIPIVYLTPKRNKQD